MNLRMWVGICFLMTWGCVSPAFGLDAFERHVATEIQKVTEAGTPLKSLSLEEAGKWKLLGPGVESPAIMLKTSNGNWAKALLSWGFRKQGEKVIPVLMLDRYVTYRSDRENVTAATGKDVMLFAGFHFDFDLGQVVPEGYGGDVVFTAEALLKPLDSAEVFGVDGPQLEAVRPDAAADPQDHDGVLPQDFAGSWKLNADGRWIASCEITVTDEGEIRGTYVSAETQSNYPITGKPGALPHHAKLEVDFVNSILSLDSYLWTKDKSAMAGTMTLAGRKFGFYALRVKVD